MMMAWFHGIFWSTFDTDVNKFTTTTNIKLVYPWQWRKQKLPSINKNIWYAAAAWRDSGGVGMITLRGHTGGPPEPVAEEGQQVQSVLNIRSQDEVITRDTGTTHYICAKFKFRTQTCECVAQWETSSRSMFDTKHRLVAVVMVSPSSPNTCRSCLRSAHVEWTLATTSQHHHSPSNIHADVVGVGETWRTPVYQVTLLVDLSGNQTFNNLRGEFRKNKQTI